MSSSSYSGGSHGPVKQEPYVATSEYGKIPKTGKCCGWFGFLSSFIFVGDFLLLFCVIWFHVDVFSIIFLSYYGQSHVFI